MDIVYLIEKSQGDWDDYHSWVDRAYQSKSRAEEYILRYNHRLNILKEKIIEFLPKDEFNDVDLDWRWRYHEVLDMKGAYLREVKVY